jgi:hypothetical protein
MTTQSTAQLTSEGVLEIGLPRSYKSASERSGIRFHVRGAGRDVSLTGRKRTWPEDDKVVYPGLATDLPVDGDPAYVVVATDRAGSEDEIPVTTASDEGSRAQVDAARTAALASQRAVGAREAARSAGDARREAEAAAQAAHALRDGSDGAADKAADLVATFSATAADCATRAEAAAATAEQAADAVSELSAKVKEGAPPDAPMRAAAKATEAFEHADEAERMATAARAAADAAQHVAETRALIGVPVSPAATPMTQGVVVHCQPEQWYGEGGVEVECGAEAQADEQQEQKPQEQQAEVAEQVQQEWPKEKVQQGGSEPEPDACCNVSAARTSCGLLLTLPKPVCDPQDVKVVLDLPCKDVPGWVTRPAGPTGYELLPPPGVELPTGPFWAKVTYPCDESKYCANVQIPGVQPHAGGDGCCDIFRVPLRVDTTGSSAAGGALSSDDLAPWAGRLIDRFLPGISRTTEPLRIREAFAKLLPPTPNGLGIRAATLATAGAGLSITPVAWPSTATVGWAGGAPGGAWPQGWAATPAGAATALPVGSMATAGGWPPSWGPGSGALPPGAITGLQPQVRTAVSGPFALFRTSADVLEMYALTALRDLRPLLQTADLDLVESERALTEDAMLGVITEFRRENGPEFGAAQVFMDALVAHVIPTGGVVSPLGAALGVSPLATARANAQSAEDYENIGRFQALEEWVREAANLLATWVPGADPRADLIEVRGLLAVVVEKADQLADELTIAHIDEQQRRTIEITPTGLKVVTLAGLLDWIRVESGQRLPSLLDRAAAQTAGDTVQTILTDQQTYVDYVRATNAFPWTHLPVSGAAQDLSAQLSVTATRAGNL